ncbi:hypothetical protein M3Y96_00614100 [Aphelenchoides besseyi]|nr:hypothetical protein M3Y96_00614100 [Aphelenchoides besseyi]
MLLRGLYLLLTLLTANAELQFAKSMDTAPIDSSAQYRSVIMPKIFGGGLAQKPLKTSNGPKQRQRYYKPSNKSDCPMSPYALYLNESDQADLYQLVQSARENNVNEKDIKDLMREYMKNSLTPERFKQFQRENDTFEARLARRQRLKREAPRLYEKQRPKSIAVKNKRQLFDIANDPAQNVKSINLRRASN